MMGVQATLARLFYDFCLDEHVPSDHMLRSIDRHLSLDEVRQALKPFYSSTGRPSIDPELMIRILIVGYCMGIRSERRLCEEVHLNLAYRWFCRLGLDGKVPVHSTFSKNRHGHFRESNVLHHLFETVVERCMAEGLVGADGFAVDASLIAVDANKQRSVPSDEWKPEEVKDKACRAAREYLATLDDAAFGAASPVTLKFISPSDPAAQWTGAHKGHAFFAYATNYLIDTDHGVIVDVEATRAIRQAEVGAARTMLERTEDRFGLKPDYLTADSAYGSAESLAWLVKQKKITPHIPVFDMSTRTDGTFSRADFPFDPEGIDIRARLARSWSSSGAHTLPHGPALLPKAHASIAPARRIVTFVNSRRVAARMRSPARFRVICTKMLATLPGLSPRHRNMRLLAAAGKRSRCCLPTSSESSGSGACGCGGHAAPTTNSSSRRRRRTCGGSRD
jgi:transposase